MIYKKLRNIFILLLSFTCFGCGIQKIQTTKTEQKDANVSELPAQASRPDLPIVENILDAFLSQTDNSDKEWEVCFAKETEDIIAAFIVPKGMQQVAAKNGVQLKADMVNEQYLAFYNIAEKKFLCQPIKERGISQLCFYEKEGHLYVGIIYEISFAGWEEYSMQWLCYEKGSIKRLWNKREAKDPYHYWKNRKPAFIGEDTISIFTREAQEGALEALMQNCELTANDNYSNYIPEYQWVAEHESSIAQWIDECNLSDTETIVAGTDALSRKCILTGTELISMLFDVEETNLFQNQIYFSAGFEGAAVEIYDAPKKDGILTGTYFIVKKYSDSHQAGLQSLYIGSLDPEGRKITQCFEYSGDHSAAKWIAREDCQCILFYAESVYNGMPSTIGGILKAEKGRLSLLWPDNPAEGEAFGCEAYWHPCNCGKELEDNTGTASDLPIHRTARIEKETLKIYRINFTFSTDNPTVMEYDLAFETEIGIEYIMGTEDSF